MLPLANERGAEGDMENRELIIGADPTGLMAAVELSCRGVLLDIIDAGDGPAPAHESRALALHA
jgi:2-polyprenyl-6-methoxyphenol hydroxylase-like FAD-dependent oxidoreductase